ncbi:MAG: Ig-like domain-containing protein [Candidatus Thermoplasmatota archaeon]
MDKKVITIIVAAFIAIAILSAFFVMDDEEKDKNTPPKVLINHPKGGNDVSSIVMISGTAYDPDDGYENSLVRIWIDGEWHTADGFGQWSYEWNTFDVNDGTYTIKAQAHDGISYSTIDSVTVTVDNVESVETNSHKWAVFVAAANSAPEENKKLGNGGLHLSEDMASYFIENYGYPTDNIFILFDDGWLRRNNGYGERFVTLQEREHEYDINYGSATRSSVKSVISHVVEKANQYEDSEVFLWFFGHGLGDSSKELTGGKLLQRSAIFLWDGKLTDEQLGGWLSGLNAKESCIVVDACYSGGFADKTILNLPEMFLFRSDLSSSGRVIISGASKFREGYASTESGPLFTLLWFDGIKTGKADGFKPWVFNLGRKTRLDIFKDGKVSVEEAFYYASYNLRKNKDLDYFSGMHPQINDMYPDKGFFRNNDGLILG